MRRVRVSPEPVELLMTCQQLSDVDFHPARERVYRSGTHASYPELPIEGGGTPDGYPTVDGFL
jgi:hypothetical protein